MPRLRLLAMLLAGAGAVAAAPVGSHSLLPRAKAVAASYDPVSRQGVIYLVRGLVLKRVYSDKSVLSLPVLSPLGDKIAFNRRVDFGVADGDIVVIDLSGRVLSSTLINKATTGMISAGIQGIESIAWMDENRLAVWGNANPAVSLGFIFRARPSSLAHPQSAGSDPGDGSFGASGPSSISPLGTHIVAAIGLSQSYPYTSCAGDDIDAATEAPEIDGIAVPPPGLKKMVVVAPFSWADETRFSTIIRYSKGLAILTARSIPARIETVRLPGRPGEPAGRPKAVNPPAFDITTLPIRQADIPSAVFEGFYDRVGKYRIQQYVQDQPKIVANWTLSQGRLVRADEGDVAIDPRDPEQAERLGSAIAADVQRLMVAQHVPAATISSVNVWCRDPACGPLAMQPAANRVAVPGLGVEVPEICMKQ